VGTEKASAKVKRSRKNCRENCFNIKCKCAPINQSTQSIDSGFKRVCYLYIRTYA
jgi:hypothetical protein